MPSFVRENGYKINTIQKVTLDGNTQEITLAGGQGRTFIIYNEGNNVARCSPTSALIDGMPIFSKTNTIPLVASGTDKFYVKGTNAEILKFVFLDEI